MIIKSKKDFFYVKDLKEINATPSNSTLIFDYNLNLCKFCQKNSIKYAVKVSSILELIYANSFNPAYIIVDKKIVKEAQDIANEYLFDSKILVKIVFEWQIEDFAKLGIDGVYIYK